MGEDLSNVVDTAAQHREEGVAGGAFQLEAREAAVRFRVADFGFGSMALRRLDHWLRKKNL